MLSKTSLISASVTLVSVRDTPNKRLETHQVKSTGAIKTPKEFKTDPRTTLITANPFLWIVIVRHGFLHWSQIRVYPLQSMHPSVALGMLLHDIMFSKTISTLESD